MHSAFAWITRQLPAILVEPDRFKAEVYLMLRSFPHSSPSHTPFSPFKRDGRWIVHVALLSALALAFALAG